MAEQERDGSVDRISITLERAVQWNIYYSQY